MSSVTERRSGDPASICTGVCKALWNVPLTILISAQLCNLVAKL